MYAGGLVGVKCTDLTIGHEKGVVKFLLALEALRQYSYSLMYETKQQADRRQLRTLAWLVLGAAVGIASGVAFAVPDRQLFFLAVLGAGVFTMVHVNVLSKQRRRLARIAIPARASSVNTPIKATRPQLFADESEVLSPEDARQALDDFLSHHQK